MEQTVSKVVSLDEALTHIIDGTTLMFGGFGGVGNPPTIIDGILRKGVTDLDLIGNDSGFPDIGIGRLVTAERARSLITSHIGSNPNAGRLMTEGKMKVTFYPQGTLAEKIRAGGMGLGGILVDVGLGTIVEEGKKRIEVEGKTYMVEPALTAQVGIVHALKADEYGNLIYDKSARNFNPLVAMAADITIAEVEEIVPRGELDPECIVTPGVYVDYIVKSEGVNWKWAWE
ncbi:CoA transferase subunit A [Aneurinibacillus aneurinilyticus]|jgi:acetate CoA/acetoacetate CoA-transferase alpha subunit|uniref:CoA transferase subunit A n=2 Tax=Aneurinibacillus aneurinilyticus TaxID=1391 RepID=A0A848CYB7_ANEAE|nr:CoA transferase subunit A [Aneurinibacillus aneurinilyticus]ERI09016.1 3-oxoacid CoA-transferase, A subunit [Aneurinibacillus aneurinilyticus ATCC 12856]MED0672990.1 CoA transferase subunit A [Aneurinibacillus aneurinilyticus]MED0709586.1 CoA transferase subunit A [Aneurinibacillus aneurinilyticus]MED0723434.1 CoA transferase subunit A [Aneurinibacillus aneurinilyticus]MED0733319.1 CoA transferase subunit A [Aneurinibacillus aneurinilyticus]